MMGVRKSYPEMVAPHGLKPDESPAIAWGAFRKVGAMTDQQAQGRVPHHAADGKLKHYCSEGYCPDITDRQDAEARTSFVAVVDQQTQTLTDEELAKNLREHGGYIEPPNDGISGHMGRSNCKLCQEAADRLDALRLTLERLQAEPMMLTFGLNLRETWIRWNELRKHRGGWTNSMECCVQYVLSDSWRHGDCHHHSMACGDGSGCGNVALLAIDAVSFWQHKAAKAAADEEKP